MEAAAGAHTAGSKVWFFDESTEEGWLEGTVTKAEPERLTIKTASGEIQRKPEECPLQNPSSLRAVEVSCCMYDCACEGYCVCVSDGHSAAGHTGHANVILVGVAAPHRWCCFQSAHVQVLRPRSGPRNLDEPATSPTACRT